MTAYRCAVIDPPWPEYGGGGRGAQNHYRLQRVADLPHIIRHGIVASPLGGIDAEGCHVWMWTLDRYVLSGEAQKVMVALGARPVKLFSWAKTNGAVRPGELGAADLRMSLGQYGRSAHELLVFGVIGRLRQLPSGMGVPDVIPAPVPIENGRRVHSRKPPEVYRLIESISPGPRLELFARSPRTGWDVWGNESAKFTEVAS